MVFRMDRPFHYGKVRRFNGPVSCSAWAQLEDAIVETNFWMLDEHGGRHGLDDFDLVLRRPAASRLSLHQPVEPD